MKVKRITPVECFLERNYVKQGGIYEVIYEDTWNDKNRSKRYIIKSEGGIPHLVKAIDYEIIE